MTDATSAIALQGQRALWRLTDPIPPELREELGGESIMLSHLLYCRGYRTADAIRTFFSGDAISHDPFALPDMAAAVQRIGEAIARGEHVAIYGDFDCDGITAAVVLRETLRAAGLDPEVHIPSRADGHGLHPETLARLADRSVTLVVTADCGVNAIEEVRVARGMGMDVVITDHHQARIDGSLPDCPTVAPTRHDSPYPFSHLCGAGVVYKLAQALHASLPHAVEPEELLDLVALGTIADVVPLLDENRSLVVRGLRALQRTQRPGLLALFHAAGVNPGRIDPISVGYYLAPRLNAANRMATPQLAYDLLTASDPDVADALAGQLGEYNRRRQDLVTETLARIVAELGAADVIADAVREGSRAPLLIVVGEWPAGISGLLAGKLVDTYGLPAFVGTDSGDAAVSVSARSVAGAQIDEILESCEAAHPGGLFLGYGGHARAGGFRVARERLSEARETLEAEAARLVRLGEIGAVLTVDAAVRLDRLSLRAAEQVRSLAPFGSDFPEPLFLARDVSVVRVSPIGGGHARFRLRGGEGVVDGVSFNPSPEFLSLASGTRLDVVFHLQIDDWNGYRKPELRLRDWRLAE